MIKLTDETRIVTKKTKHNEVGDEVDNSLYLERLDDHNLVLKRGNTILNYFGDVRVALKRSLNYAIKGSTNELNLKEILRTIDIMYKRIDEFVELKDA